MKQEALTFTLSKEDYLTHQLFVASHSENIRKQRQRLRVFVPILWIITGLILSYRHHDYKEIVIFIVISLGWYILEPKYSAWRYKRHYSKHIDEQYDGRIGKENKIFFNDEIEINSQMGTSKLKYEAVESLQELQEYYFLQLEMGVSIIIPKESVLDKKEFEEKVKQKTGLPWQDYSTWEWK